MRLALPASAAALALAAAAPPSPAQSAASPGQGASPGQMASPAQTASPAQSAAPPSPAQTAASPGAARLDTTFAMTGKVTKAVRIRGEHAGQIVHRTWAFTALCPRGPCSRVQLVRQRQSGTDKLVLKRISRGYYEGNGKFYARLRCDGRLYYRGMSVPFTIQVHVTRAAVVGGRVLASRIRATYTNRSRKNHTPCIAIPGHDAARYTGVATTAAGPVAQIARAIAQSPAGS